MAAKEGGVTYVDVRLRLRSLRQTTGDHHCSDDRTWGECDEQWVNRPERDDCPDESSKRAQGTNHQEQPLSPVDAHNLAAAVRDHPGEDPRARGRTCNRDEAIDKFSGHAPNFYTPCPRPNAGSGADRHAELVIASGAGVRAVVESAAGTAAHNGTSARLDNDRIDCSSQRFVCVDEAPQDRNRVVQAIDVDDQRTSVQ